MKAMLPERHTELSTFLEYSDNEKATNSNCGVKNKWSKYRKAIAKLQKKCEFLSQSNERLVRRLHCIKRITIRKKRDVDLLKTRLDVYSDEWRTAQPDPITKIKMPTNLTPTGKVRKMRTKKSGVETQNLPVSNECETKPIEENFSKRKRAKSDKEKDPNAPKRPANPFFQFCQEQRSKVMDELNNELQPGQPELSKQELTRQLAQRWRSMDQTTKQIYVNKYENSKQKYNLEMLSYKKDSSLPPPKTVKSNSK